MKDRTITCKTYAEAKSNFEKHLDLKGNLMPEDMQKDYRKIGSPLGFLIFLHAALANIKRINSSHTEIDDHINRIFGLIQDGIHQLSEKELLRVHINKQSLLQYLGECGEKKIFNLLWTKVRDGLYSDSLINLYHVIQTAYYGSSQAQNLNMSSSIISRGNPCYALMAKSVLVMILKSAPFQDLKDINNQPLDNVIKGIRQEIIGSRSKLMSAYNKDAYVNARLKPLPVEQQNIFKSVYIKQFQAFVTNVDGHDLFLKLYLHGLIIHKVLFDLDLIQTSNIIPNRELQKKSALAYIKKADLTLDEILTLQEVFLYKTEFSGTNLDYIRTKTKYLAKISHKEEFGDTNTYKEILNNLNSRVEKHQIWQSKWDKTEGTDLEKSLALFFEYSGSYETTLDKKPHVWGGDVGRFFKGRWGTHHGQVVQSCLKSYFEQCSTQIAELSPDKDCENKKNLILLLSELKTALGDVVLKKDGDLNIILQVIFENTGIEFNYIEQAVAEDPASFDAEEKSDDSTISLT